jgi:electron transfer flavoprotein alpha subunit
MANECLVLVEQWRGRIAEVSYELLALGREVAAGLDGPLQAVLLGSGVGDLAPLLEGADGVLLGEHAALADPVPEMLALALTQVIQLRRPAALLIPQTNVTMEVGPLVAAGLGLPFVNFCRDVRVTEGRPTVRCVLCGGKVEATVAPLAAPAVLGILPGARPAEQGRTGRAPTVTPVTLDLPAESRVRFAGYTEPPPGDVDIARENVLVAVGRGIQRPENVVLAEELAGALGGAVCGSRPVIDQGWLPASRQVGTSGLIVKPALYLALGISGAPEHVEGMKHAALIIAVNTDPRAPIFNVAHYGTTVDALEVLPALSDAVRSRKRAA